jgi:ribonuclease BN (tRNA processing enzyme)
MKVRILGCSGGIGGSHRRTAAMLVDDDVLVDCGTGVGELTLDELARIDHVFLTHSHLDHVAGLPLLIDTVGDLRSRPVTVYAIEATLEILRAHIFNWAIWPDFNEIPSVGSPQMCYQPVHVGAAVELGGRTITALPANHTVPAVGYRLDSGRASLVTSGDTGPCAEFWAAVNQIDNLRYLIIETAFSNREQQLASVSKHLCPSTLTTELATLRRAAEIYITHLKPGQSELTMREIDDSLGELRPRMLENDQIFDF